MSGRNRDDDAGDGRRDGGDDGPAAHRTILERLRDAVGNPCIPRYVDPVRVGSRLPGLVYPGSGRWYAASSPPGCSRSRSPRPLPPSPASSGPASRSIRASSSRPNGPVAINILSGPRPGGTTTLAPSLSNDTLTGRETLTAIERRTAPQATTAGINGDFFAFATGLPSGVLMQDGQVMSPPSAYRASAGVTSDGTLDVRRVTLSGTWQGCGGKRTLNQFNKPLEGNGIALYTQVWGPATPPKPGAVSAILFPFPAATPNTDLQAPVVELRTGGAAVPIPPGGAVLVAVGAAAAALTAEAPVGQIVTTQLNLKPDWPDIVSAIGGGPQIVRDGAPIFRAGEIFTTSQLGPRAPRSAVGQLADGKMILVTVDGRQPGYSIGMTNFELAQALVRLGAVTGMALDSGGSATMAFDGTLLNRPSEPERPISTALLFQYTGVFVQPAVAVVSPDGDGVADKQSLRLQGRAALDRRGEAAAARTARSATRRR